MQKGIYRNIQPLVLASASPRRRRLLNELGIAFEVLPSGIAEETRRGERPEEAVLRWATEKAEAVAQLRPGLWVLAADTAVARRRELYGKPSDPEDARSMLRGLSGKTHRVVTGVCLCRTSPEKTISTVVRSFVRFRTLSEEEIAAYVATGEPLDKAGAYGIQGLGAFLVRSVGGSYTNVVGLPLTETLELLMREGIIVPAGA